MASLFKALRQAFRKREAPAQPSGRAPRYEMEIPLRFRRRGEIDWQGGTTVNISLSGVLFRAEQIMQAGTPVEMNFVLPPGVGWTPGAEVVWPGQIVRAVPPATSDSLPALAVKILESRPPTRQWADLRRLAQDDRGPLARG